MSATVDASGLDGVLIYLEKLAATTGERLAAAVEIEAIKTVAAVVDTKLSGQVLNQRTGRLASSIHQVTERTGNSVIATVGTDVVYARIHEYGGTIVPKVAKALRFVIGDKTIVAKSVTMPQRSFLRSTLSDREQDIRAALAVAVAGAA